jgi:hypothetical protein
MNLIQILKILEEYEMIQIIHILDSSKSDWEREREREREMDIEMNELESTITTCD